MTKVTATADIVNAIWARARVTSPLLVAVDGLPGSGKSVLSEELAAVLPATHVEGDSFLEPNQGEYLAYLRLKELTSRLRLDLANSQVVLFDAVCALAALKGAGVEPGLHIYVMKLDSRGDWFDGETFTTENTEPEAIAEEEELAAAMGGELPQFARELIHYHFEHRPWERADIAYLRSDVPEA